MTVSVRVFECARGGDVDLVLDLPTTWALAHAGAVVVFEDWEVCGWHAVVESTAGDRLLRLHWYDHVDKMLRGELPSELPPTDVPADGWDDLEQGWWAAIRVVGDDLYIAETNFDRLLDVPGVPTADLVRPGLVRASGVEVSWNRLPTAAWRGAWEAAKASCARGTPSPSRPFRPAAGLQPQS